MPPVPARGRSPSRREQIRDLYTIVFVIAVVIFVVVEGLIVWSVLRYRRRPEDVDLPPQTHGNNLSRSSGRSIPTVIVAVPVRRSRGRPSNTVDAAGREPGRPDPRRRRPVPVAVRVPRRRATATHDRCTRRAVPAGEGGGMVRAGRRDGPADADQPATSSTPSTSRSSCSSATSSRAGSTTFEFTVDGARPGRSSAASAPSCAAPATGSCCSTSTRMAAGRLRRLAATAPDRDGQRDAAAARQRASAAGPACGAQCAKNIAFDRPSSGAGRRAVR